MTLPACSPSLAMSGDSEAVASSASLTYTAAAYPVTISLGGTTTVNGVQEALSGQQISASVNLNGAPGTVTGCQWDIESADGGSLVGGYSAQQGAGQTLAISSFHNPTVTFYDGIQDTVTVNAIATITFPDNTTGTVSAAAQTLIVKPTVTGNAFTSSEYDNFTQHPNDTSSSIGANELWAGVTISMPSGFSGGTGCFAQKIDSTSRVDTRHTGGNYTIQEKLGNGTWVAVPAPCLDTNFPYPYATEWDVTSTGSGGDQPYFPVAPTLDADDTGNSDWYQASGNDAFQTWIMFNPNTQNSANIWVPLDMFDWNWSNTASLNTSVTPNVWQVGTFPGNSGSDIASTSTWPTWNTWVPYGVILNNPTGEIAMHE